ncbi:hypothetical protein J4Q44_G00380310 [Coregonus suidteri]|uniref:Uncharacterized protein n=1 Tax=Coregonus suidteri TaxID=861788 RepID=A0AAN8KRS3_9TELE
MKSDWSMAQPLNFREGDFSTEQRGQWSKMSLSGEREEGGPASKMRLSEEHDTKAKSPIKQERPASPVPSCVSMKSDWSMVQPEQFREGDFSSEQRNQQERSESEILSELPEGFESQKQDKEVVDAEDEKQESSAREGALKITLHVLRKMNQKELADTLEKSFPGGRGGIDAISFYREMSPKFLDVLPPSFRAPTLEMERVIAPYKKCCLAMLPPWHLFVTFLRLPRTLSASSLLPDAKGELKYGDDQI